MEDRHITNRSFRVILLGIEDITGENGLKSLLNFAGLSRFIKTPPPDNLEIQDIKISNITILAMAIEEVFGKDGAKATLLRTGRMMGKAAISEYPDVLKIVQDSIKGMAGIDKVEAILKLVAAAVSSQFREKIWVERDGEILYNKSETATYCLNRKSEEPVCHGTAGFIYEMAASQLPTEEFEVKEIGCMSMGEPYCTFQVTIK